MVGVRSGRVRMMAVRRVIVPWRVRMMPMGPSKELAAAGCAHTVRGAGGSFGVGVGGSGGGGLLGCAVLSHRAVRKISRGEEFAAAVCARTVRGGGGGGGGGLHRYSHRAAQLEEEQNTRDHRASGCECGRHSYLREVLGRERGSSVMPRSC